MGILTRKLAVVFGAVAMLAPVGASAEQLTTDYTVTFLGIPVAHSTFTGSVDSKSFKISGTMNSAGIAKLFDDTTGSASISGGFAGADTRPANFETHYRNGKKRQLTSIKFSSGAVASTVNQPALKKNKDKTPVSAGQLRGVVDPLSASLIKASSLGDVCNRTLKVFDGEMRFNLVLSPASTAKVNGLDAATCSGKFVPVAGYRTTNKSIKYLRDNANISISFAEIADTGIYAPIRATVSTTLGPVTVSGKRR